MADEKRKAGRPKLDVMRRVRVATTIEPMKLVILRRYAESLRMSIGQLADVLVREYVTEKSGTVTTTDMR
jgi:hypothetical protein